MLRDRNIAFFIDVDNVGLKSDNYSNVMEQLAGMGNILFGKIYGAGERKHKDIYADALLHGYRIERTMRVKRRGRKEFDPRIYVDVVDAVARTPAIDAVCIIAEPTDLVYLYSYLRARGIKVIALDNADDASCAFIDEVIDLGVVYELKLPGIPKEKPAAAVEAAPAPQVEPDAGDTGLDRTGELLKEIERLRSSVPEEPAREEQPVPADVSSENMSIAEQFVKQPEEESAEEPTASIVDETRSLLERIAEMRETSPSTAQPEEQPVPTEQSTVEEEQPAQTESPAPVEEQPHLEESAPEEPAETVPHAPVAGANDSDLIKRIEEIRRSSQGADDEFIEEIRKLLDGLE